MSASDTQVKKINIQPGINKNTTELDAEGVYVSCDKIRFFYNKPEKIGGWISEQVDGSINGVARDIISWTDLSAQEYLGFGTNSRLYIFNGGELNDITPITASACASNVYNTSAGSKEVILSVNPVGRQAGDYFILTTTTASAAGADFTQGDVYEITSVGAGSIRFEADTTAVSSEAGVGGAVKVDYLLETGAVDNGVAFGWGAGTWDTEGVSACAGWSEPRGEGVGVNLQEWSLDNYGEDLVANVRGGNIYRWRASDGLTARASILSTAAPSINEFVLVAQDGRHVISFGTHTISGAFDPLFIRWSDSEDVDTWTAAATNQAGSFRLESGSFIIGAQETRGEILVFTDENVYSMKRVGGGVVFSFQDLGKHNGLQSQQAVTDVNGIVYWMGYNSFHYYDGIIRTLPCSLQKFIFESDSDGSLNTDQKEKVFCGKNREFNEIWWFYPSKGSSENNRYIIYNYMENTWYHGTLDRTVWQDVDIFDRPYAIDSNGQLYIHEQGKNNDAGGLAAFLQTSFFDIDDGDKILFVDRYIPDHTITKEMEISFNYKKYPQSNEEFTKGPYKIKPATRKIHPRIRGRQLQLTYRTSVIGSDFRIGGDRIAIQPDGER